MELIATSIDFLGINYDNPYDVRLGGWDDLRRDETALPGHPGVVTYTPPELTRTIMDWIVEPDALYDLLVGLAAEASGLPLYITENGCATEDYVNPEGELNDFERFAYLHGHFDAAARAIEAGATLAGYFVWSLMDHFEIAWGYQRRFGLYFVEFATQRRIPKRSALFYAEVARTGSLPDRDAVLSARDFVPASERSMQPAIRALSEEAAV
jgi:beta-glucosidase